MTIFICFDFATLCYHDYFLSKTIKPQYAHIMDTLWTLYGRQNDVVYVLGLLFTDRIVSRWPLFLENRSLIRRPSKICYYTGSAS